MPTGNYTTPWGKSVSVPVSPWTVARSGSYFYILLMQDGRYRAGFNSPTTSRTTIKDSLSEANAWVESLRKAYLPEPVVVPPTPTPQPAYFAVSSTPSGASIFLDATNTGKTTPRDIEASPGSHSVGVSLSGYNSAVKIVTAVAAKSTGVSFTLTKIAAPVTPTVPTVPTVPTKVKEARSLMEAISLWLTGDVPDWLDKWEDFLDWLTNTFGTTMPAFEVDKITGEFKRKPEGKKVIFMIGMSAPISTVGKTAATAIVSQTADDFLATAIKEPQTALAWIKSLTTKQLGEFYATIQQPYVKTQVIQTVDRLWLDTMAKKLPLSANLLKHWKLGLGAVIGFAGWIGWVSWPQIDNVVFALTGGIRNLISAKQWDAAREAINNARAGFAIMRANQPLYALGNAFFLGAWESELAGWEKQFDDMETIISTEAPTAPITEVPGVPAEVPSNAGRLQVLVYDKATNASINATLVIDGVSQPYHLHAYNIDLAPGPHEIRVEEEGYTRYDDTIVITASRVTTINVFLEKPAAPEVPTPEAPLPEEVPPVPTMGKVQVTANVEAEIWSAGTNTGYITPAVIELAPGIYDITLKAEGYITETKTAYVKAGEVYSLAFLLTSETKEPPVRKAWRLDIDSSPSSAKILINYAFTGKYTPDYVLLDPGEYVVSLTKSGYKRWEQAVSLQEF